MELLKGILFHVLMTFRGMIQAVLKIAGGLMMLAAIVWGIYGQYTLAGGLAVCAVVVNAVGWGYDSIVLKLAPPGSDLGLYR
ncbi:hypothetical protein [Chromobacterium vaccinii]|uniref:Uncharacterized protein n=1 Tax=Chromobacterium vaccinii TaxID=1108595 RepID=A0A1D9LBZ4_9NEIS|nr:hypothetical protein [Chromobacterium vaccinii]AOZ48797.1 hypothetical protein BKX93_01495 [Chromobacterium vaccinii]